MLPWDFAFWAKSLLGQLIEAPFEEILGKKRTKALLPIFFFSCLFFRNFRCDCGNKKFPEFKCKLYSVGCLLSNIRISFLVTLDSSVVLFLYHSSLESNCFHALAIL